MDTKLQSSPPAAPVLSLLAFALLAASASGADAQPRVLRTDRAVTATRARFDRAIDARMDRLYRTASDCIAAAGLSPADVDTIFLTGGSSRVPAVRAAIARAAPSARLAGSSDLLSVALGLTHIAGMMD